MLVSRTVEGPEAGIELRIFAATRVPHASERRTRGWHTAAP